MPLPSSLPDLDALLRAADAEAGQYWRQQRARYQRGLLVWLKTPDDPLGLPEMQAALLAALSRALAAVQIDEYSESWIAFWQAGNTLLDCLAGHQLSPDMAVRRLAGRIDQQFRRQETAGELPDGLLQEELRHCTAPFLSAAVPAALAPEAAFPELLSSGLGGAESESEPDPEPEPEEVAVDVPAAAVVAEEIPLPDDFPFLQFHTPDFHAPENESADAAPPLASTPQAAAALLPLLAGARTARYSAEKAAPWKAACCSLLQGWAERLSHGLGDFRTAVFALCAAAVELNDPECLRLAEALASASDRLESDGGIDNLPLAAAITATLECLGEPDNLEHPAFADRVRHLSGRLENCARLPAPAALLDSPAAQPLQTSVSAHRSPTIDRLFAEEAGEILDQFAAALDAVPPSAAEAADIMLQLHAAAETLELAAICTLSAALADVLDLLGRQPVSEDWRVLALDLEEILRKQITAVSNGLTPVTQVLEAPLLGALRQLAGLSSPGPAP